MCSLLFLGVFKHFHCTIWDAWKTWSPLLCAYSQRFGRGGGGLPTFGMEKAFRRSIHVWSSDHAVGFAALLQFRGTMTTQMHLLQHEKPWRRTLLLFFFEKYGALRADDLRISSPTTGAGRLVKTAHDARSTRCGNVFRCSTRRTLCETGAL